MKKDSILNQLTKKKVTDYGFLVAFFLVFAFFVAFAIRPNLTTAFRLRKELSELQVIDKNYDDVIHHIVGLEAILETHRDDLFLLDDALPATPQVNKIIDDMQISASSSGIIMKKVDVEKINLKEDTNKKLMKSYTVHMETDSAFDNVKQFMDSFFTQRRLKVFKNVEITKQGQNGSGSATLKIKFDVDGYYL